MSSISLTLTTQAITERGYFPIHLEIESGYVIVRFNGYEALLSDLLEIYRNRYQSQVYAKQHDWLNFEEAMIEIKARLYL
jgi:hypothetical protein